LREERRRCPDHAGVRHQGRRLLRGRRRHPGPAGGHLPDQPDLELRPVQPGPGVRGFAAGLVHGLDGRPAAVVAVRR